jgi:hypothetical protein
MSLSNHPTLGGKPGLTIGSALEGCVSPSEVQVCHAALSRKLELISTGILPAANPPIWRMNGSAQVSIRHYFE